MNTSCKPAALGIALGSVWGSSVLFIGLTAMGGWGTSIVQALASFYVGYNATIAGAVIGGIWGFFDGLIGGLLIAWVYNLVAK